MSKERLDQVEHQPLEEFTASLHFWRNFFDGRRVEEVNESDIDDAEEELESCWPYREESCYYSGMGLAPVVYPRQVTVEDLAEAEEDYEPVPIVEFDINSHYVLDEYDYIPGKWGTSHGIKVANFDGGDHYKIYFKFFDFGFDDTTSNETLQAGFSFFSYLSVEGNVMPISNFDTGDTANEHVDDRDSLPHIKSISEASAALQALYRSVPFRRQRRHVQVRQVDAFLAACEQKFGLIANTPVEIQSDEVYRAVIGDGQLTHAYIGATQESEPLQGYFLGYGSPERVELDRRPIRRDVQLVSRTAGLCAIVELAGKQPLNFNDTAGVVYAAVRSDRSITETTIRSHGEDVIDDEEE